MAGAKRDRQRTNRQAQAAAIAEAKRKAERQRQLKRGAAAAAVLAVLIVAIVVVVRSRGGDGKKVGTAGETNVTASTTSAPSTPSATSATALASAAGKPCVAVGDPLPEGAPAVPVKVGPPPTKLVIQDLKDGTGAAVVPTSTVTVNYIGVSCSTGKIFDSSYSTKTPATFALAQVIKGWQDGIPGMKVGGQRLLGIPSSQAYGPNGQGALIGPDEALWFVVEVIAAQTA